LSKARIKICGLRRIADTEAVNSVMPDYIGFVFAGSRRQVTPETAENLRNNLDERIQSVGVFVNQPIDFIAGLFDKRIINLVQLHGDEDDEYMESLRYSCGCEIIKSVSIVGELPVLPKAADYLLFDSASAQRGGTGKTFNRGVLEEYTGIPYFLAGGLNTENVGEALRYLLPFGVDVSSGVETDGFKDADKIKEFIRIVRGD